MSISGEISHVTSSFGNCLGQVRFPRLAVRRITMHSSWLPQGPLSLGTWQYLLVWGARMHSAALRNGRASDRSARLGWLSHGFRELKPSRRGHRR